MSYRHTSCARVIGDSHACESVVEDGLANENWEAFMGWLDDQSEVIHAWDSLERMIETSFQNAMLSTQCPRPQDENFRTRNKSSKFRGVSKCKKDGRFQVRIRVGNTVHYVGRWGSEEEAARKYDSAARELHGKRAILNFP